MFTPPPSPLPISAHFPPPPPISDSKRSFARRTRITVIVVPLILAIVTLSTRFLAHPAAFDIFSEPRPESWQELVGRAADWSVHKRHVHLERGLGEPEDPPRAFAASSETLPTVPASPPALPTPFPQPFDSDVYQNFSTTKCSVFFANMTNVQQFRSCRPFSLLLQSSNEFLGAQRNLTLLNNIIWGTCNTSESEQECISTMDWFADELQKQCATEVKGNNALVLDTLTALHSYSLLRSAACLTDAPTNAYCFVSATLNSDLSDFLFYTLPLGIPLPKTATPTCSACVKSIMARYATALTDDPDRLNALSRTYADAADLTRKTCGTTYATTVAAAISSNTQNAGTRQQTLLTGLVSASVLAVASLSGLYMLW